MDFQSRTQLGNNNHFQVFRAPKIIRTRSLNYTWVKTFKSKQTSCGDVNRGQAPSSVNIRCMLHEHYASWCTRSGYGSFVVDVVCKSSAHCMTHWNIVPASWRTNSNQLNFMQHVAGTNVFPAIRMVFANTGMSHKENWHYMSLQYVPSVCRP